MNLAVKMYSHVDNPHGIPPQWPAQVIENVDVPPAPEWVIMSHTEYQNYVRTHLPAYQSWERVCPYSKGNRPLFNSPAVRLRRAYLTAKPVLLMLAGAALQYAFTKLHH